MNMNIGYVKKDVIFWKFVGVLKWNVFVVFVVLFLF